MKNAGKGSLMPCGSSFIALLEAFRATGGTAPEEVLTRLLEEYQLGKVVSLARLVYTDQIFSFHWRTNHWIPMFQFDDCDLAINEGAQKVRAELPPQCKGWALASWFATPNARLEGMAPVDRLYPDLAGVINAARVHSFVDARSQ